MNNVNPIINLNRVGNAKKFDSHHAFPDMVDNYANEATKFKISTKGKGGKIIRESDLYQLKGGLNKDDGSFEWIVDNNKVTHRRFIKNGEINGVPNQTPFKK